MIKYTKLNLKVYTMHVKRTMVRLCVYTSVYIVHDYNMYGNIFVWLGYSRF